MNRHRSSLPRFFEIIDAQSNPIQESDAFPLRLLDETNEESYNTDFLSHIESQLQCLDSNAWTVLKAKVTPLPKRDKNRGILPLYDILNEAQGYNHLVRSGCTGVYFVSISSGKGNKAPDLAGFDADCRRILCDVKTINISEREINHRRRGCAAESLTQLDVGFLGKVRSDMNKARDQMVHFDPDDGVRKLVFFVINYDDGEYAADLLPQLKNFIDANAIADLEVQFDDHTASGVSSF